MDDKAQLARKIVSANDNLRAAQRDGNHEKICAAYIIREGLLEQLYPGQPANASDLGSR